MRGVLLCVLVGLVGCSSNGPIEQSLLERIRHGSQKPPGNQVLIYIISPGAGGCSPGGIRVEELPVWIQVRGDGARGLVW